MKNILVATDFSNDAYCALFYAAKLLSSQPCIFHILNVYDENTPLRGKKTKLLGSQKRLKELEIESKQKLTNTLHRIVLDTGNSKHSFQTISQKGILVKVLIKIVEAYGIDLLVMGTKGNTGVKEIFLGSNTVQATNSITLCPVLAVPKQIDYKAPKEISFVTDFKKGCVKKTLAPLLFFASLTDASIRVMHINEEEILNAEQESHRKLLQLNLKGLNHSLHWMQGFANKAQVIDTFLEKYAIDMFAMVNNKRSFFEKLVREPVIKDVSMYADIPFLILPDLE